MTSPTARRSSARGAVAHEEPSVETALATVRAQRVLTATAVVLAAIVINIGEGDIFALPKATAIVVCAVLAVALSVIRWSWSRTAAIPAEPAAIAAGLFVLALLLTTITSTTPVQSLVGQYSQHAGLVAYASYVAFFVVVLRTFAPGNLPTLVRAFVASAVVVVGYATLQVVGIDPVDWALQGSVVGTLGNPNFLAGWVGIVLPLVLWAALFSHHHVAWRVAGAAVALAIPVVAWETDSFQGPVTVGASAVAFVLLAVRVPRRLLLAGAAAAAVVLVVLAPRIQDQIENGMLEREHFWSVALDVAREHPVLGTGPDTFHNEFLPRRPAEHAAIPASKNAGAAHDVPLDHLAGGGLVTVVPYLAFVGIVGWKLVRGIRRVRHDADHRLLLAGLGAAWVGYQVQSLVSIDKPPLAFAHFVLAGAVLVAAGPQRWLDVALPGTTLSARGAVPPATWAVSGLALVLAIAGIVVASRPLRADIEYAAGVDALQAGDGRGVLRIEQARGLAPWEAQYTFELARGRAALGEVDAALAAAEEGARLEPGDSSYALVPAQIASQLRLDDVAVRWYDEALRRDPFGLDVLAAASAHAAVSGDADRTAELVDRMLDVTDDRWDVWADAYAALAAIGDDEGAAEARARALELNPAAELEEASR